MSELSFIQASTAPATTASLTADLAALGEAFARDTGLERHGPVGTHLNRATARFMPQRALVNYGVGWIERHRS